MKYIAFILIMTAGLGTHFGQSTTADSTLVEYTAKQDSTCLHCLMSRTLTDSLILQQTALITLTDSLYKSEQKQRHTAQNEIDLLNNEKSLFRIKKMKSTWIAGIFGFLLGAVIL